MSYLLKRFGALLLVFAAFQLSCSKLDRGPGKEGTLPIITLNKSDSIPLEWGKLISTTNSPDSPNLVLLWFQNDGGDIHLASYFIRENRLSMNTTVIHRD